MHALDLILKPSPMYSVIFASFVLTSIVIVCILPIVLWIKFILVLLVAAESLRVCWRYILLRAKTSITAIKYNDKRWLVETANEFLPAEIAGNSVVTSFVILLILRVSGSKRSLVSVIWRDSLSRNDYRRLLVALRLLSS